MILKLAALGALGYAGYKYYEKNQRDSNGVAFAEIGRASCRER